MSDPTTSRFWRGALQSGLLDAAVLQACWDALPEEKRAFEHLDRRLARQAVLSGVLTLWQAQQLVAGRSTGFKIDRYVLIDLIGQGGMGRVYLARDTRLNRRVAVKILSPERINNPRAIARFHREALVGAQLQHDNLVRIYDEGEAAGKCYLVMEYIEGRNIGQMMAENGPIPPAVAARLGRQVSLGLEHAQRKGLIHRDVNPYNILVTRDGQAKLTDLGLAIDLGDNDRVTRDGATVGTFDYVSPEQARHSHNVDTRSDIYSLGCTLYHMITGRVPYPSSSLPEKLFGHQALEAEPIERLAPGIPPGLAEIVRKMMRKSPDQRYTTPLELALALEPFGDDSIDPSTVVSGAILGQLAAKHAASLTEVTDSPPIPITIPDPELMPAPLPLAAPVSSTTTETEPPIPSPPTEDDAKHVPLNLGLSVDLGPSPPLARSNVKVKPKAAPKAPKPTKKPKISKPLVAGLPAWIPPVAGAVVLLLAVGGFLAFRFGGGGPSAKGAGAANSKGSKGKGKSGTATAKIPVAIGRQVVVVDRDGEMSVEPNLVNAIRSAIGGKGHVLLTNQDAMKLSTAEAINIGGGALEIRAREGLKPVLQIEIKGKTPFLTTRSDTSFKLVGITIEVTYREPGPEPAAVIEAGNNVVLEQCVFRVDPSAARPGSTAVRLEGGALVARGCGFENFDCALDLACYGGSTSKLEHCQFVNTEPALASEGKVGGGLAVQLRNMPGGFAKTGRKLILDHCTIKGRGLIGFDGFSTAAPIKVASTSCASLSDTLIVWTFDPAEAVKIPTREALGWTGQGDQHEVRGKEWVLVGARGSAFEPMPDGPVDLEGWQRKLANEQSPLPPPVTFATDPSRLPPLPIPSDFKVTANGKPVGADPERVGPGAKR